MAARVPISYYNSFWMKRTGSIVGASAVTGYTPVWPGIFWSPYNTGVFPINANTSSTEIQNRNWFIEEARIKGGFNNTSVDFGVKAYLNEDNPVQLNRSNAIIYCAIYYHIILYYITYNIISHYKSYNIMLHYITLFYITLHLS